MPRSACGICGGRSGTGAGFCPVLRVYSVNYHCSILSSGPGTMDSSTKGLSLTPTPRINTKKSLQRQFTYFLVYESPRLRLFGNEIHRLLLGRPLSAVQYRTVRLTFCGWAPTARTVTLLKIPIYHLCNLWICLHKLLEFNQNLSRRFRVIAILPFGPSEGPTFL
jgi:hypothetical protein